MLETTQEPSPDTAIDWSPLAAWIVGTAGRIRDVRSGARQPGRVGGTSGLVPTGSRWRELIARAGLTGDETLALACLVAAEADLLAGRAIDRLARDAGPPGVEVQAVATVLDYLGVEPDHGQALFAPGSALERWGLVAMAGEGRLASRRIAVSPRLLACLRGEPLVPIASPFLERVPARSLDELVVAPGVIDAAQRGAAQVGLRAWWLAGPRASGKRTLAASVLAMRGQGLLALRYRDAVAESLPRLVAVLAREALLNHAAIALVEVEVAAPGVDDSLPGLIRALARAGVPSVITATAVPSLAGFDVAPSVTELRGLEVDARIGLWQRELPTLDRAVEVGARYRLPAGRICRIARAVRDHGGAPTIHQVAAAVSAEIAQRVAVLGDRVEVTQGWDDVVLPPATLEAAREVVARVRGRHRVLSEWGFAAKLQKGLGVSALFAGPPGTGKTMVAGIIARELGLDLYQIDLSRVVSKYVGETEKSLGEVFDAAEAGNVMLLFDEADALFGKRTDVKSSNDRFANMEVNYLLQRLERFEGVCLLTTNLEGSIDAAFKRRLSFRIDFPLPDVDERAELWRRAFPAAAPIAADLDVVELAERFELAGGNIRNAALRAAYLAAARGSHITADVVTRAVALEYHDAGKLSTGGRLGH